MSGAQGKKIPRRFHDEGDGIPFVLPMGHPVRGAIPVEQTVVDLVSAPHQGCHIGKRHHIGKRCHIGSWCDIGWDAVDGASPILRIPGGDATPVGIIPPPPSAPCLPRT